jgi:2'-5' RNA ligase
VGGLSSFPKKSAPKTLWVGLTEGVEAWKTLVRRAEEPFFQMGIPKNNGLVPHITLGRVVADTENATLWKAVQAGDLAADCGTGEAHEITLVESFLHPDGAQYQNRLVLPFCVKE